MQKTYSVALYEFKYLLYNVGEYMHKGGGAMYCMKCGREIPDGQVFCQECLEVMANHPIAPETHVQLPKRPAKAPDKKPKALPPAEQILHLKKKLRRMTITTVALLVIVGALSVLLARKWEDPQTEQPIGRNFTTAPR